MREPRVPAHGEGASGDQDAAPSALVKELERTIRERLDPLSEAGKPLLSEGVQPMLDKVSEVRRQLFPEEGETPPALVKREVIREELAKALNDTEDVLEALLLKRPGAHPFSRGQEG